MSSEKPKFKPGDEIVIVKGWSVSEYNNGDRGVIIRRDSNRTDMVWWHVHFKDRNLSFVVDEGEMELAKLVDSPLWRALR